MGDISLEEIKNENVDLERIPVEEVFEQLKCTPKGLTAAKGEKRLEIFGHNKLEEKKESNFLKFLGFMWNPLSWVMEAAAIMAIVLANGGGKPPDWPDFVGIVMLLIINSTISFIEENNAGNAAAALMAGLAPKTKVLRDGKWSEQEAEILVPGDIISIKLGDIVPADARLLEGDPLKIDQAALTGESLPVTRSPGDEVFSGSTCKQGEIEAVVIATGVHTFFGKAAHLVDNTNQVGHFQKVLAAIGNFCICSIAVGMVIEIIVMWAVQRRSYRDGIDNLLVLLIGGIPIAMPTVLSVTMAIGSHRLSQQGAITKRMTAIEEMAGMDVLCSDKTGTLTLNKLTVDKTLVEVFAKGMDSDGLLLAAARASRVENQDAIDASIVGMLADPKEARAGITEVHFLPFNPVDKRTAITYIDSNGDWHRTSKGAPEQIIDLCELKGETRKKAHQIIDNFAERGLRALGVAKQTIPEKSKESDGSPWEFVGLMPLFDPPRHDSAETIRRALDLGVNVKMITGDQLAIGKETGRRLGMGTNMYPSSSLLGQSKDESIASMPVEELIEKADGFAGVFPEHKYEIVKKLQERKHICGMTGDGVNDAPALKRADIGIAVADATDAARSASDIVLTEPGLSVIVSAVLTSRAIFQRMKNYTIYAVSITIRVVLGFLLVALIWKFDFPPFMVLIIAILNDGTIMTIYKDRVKPSPMPDSWKLKEIFATGVVLGTYMALMTAVFFWLVHDTDFFTKNFGLKPINEKPDELSSALYLQVSIISQALIFVTRSRGWSFVERPGLMLLSAFLVAQLIATLLAVYATWGFARIQGIGWGWAGAIWLFSIITYFPLDILKFMIRYAQSGKAWDNLLQSKTAFTTKKDYGKGEREAQWALAQRTLHGLHTEQAKRRAEVARVEIKSYKLSPQKKSKPEIPIVVRRSLRTQRMPPDSKGLSDDFVDSVVEASISVSFEEYSTVDMMGPVSFKDAYVETGSYGALIDTILSVAKKPHFHEIKEESDKSLEYEMKPEVGDSVKEELDGVGACKDEVSRVGYCDLIESTVGTEKSGLESSVDLGSFTLKPENIARIMPGRIMQMKFLPCSDVRMVVAGNHLGNVAFWNLDSEQDEDNGIYLYRPHSGPISGIITQQSCLAKIFTSCYDGLVRLMDVEKEVFDLVYSSEEAISSLSKQPNNVNSLYFGEGQGGLNMWDERTGKSSNEWLLHEARINTIDFNSQNLNIMATSSNDGTACIWDLRSMSTKIPVKVVSHKRAVQSAYFSPSGNTLATTSFDDTIGVWSGVNFENTLMIHHNNQTGRWISPFRAIWGWDDSCIFVGNMSNKVDVISPAQRKIIATLQNPEDISAIPCSRFDAHPLQVGMLAGATGGRHVYVWTSLCRMAF